MGTKLYVGNLPFSLNEAALEALFQTFGEVVSAKIITDRDTGRSKGFGFVEMKSETAAAEAIRALHQSDLQGRPLTVSEARPQQGGGGGGGGGRMGNFGGGGGSRPARRY
jgi:RNA recognition motif-containing protein